MRRIVAWFYIFGSVDTCKKRVCAKTTLTLKSKVQFFVYCNVFCSSRGAKVSTEPWCRKWSFLLEKFLVLIIPKLVLLTMCLRFAVRCKKNGSYWYRMILQIYRCILLIFLPLSFSFYFAFSFLFFWLFKQSRTRAFYVGQISPQNYA